LASPHLERRPICPMEATSRAVRGASRTGDAMNQAASSARSPFQHVRPLTRTGSPDGARNVYLSGGSPRSGIALAGASRPSGESGRDRRSGLPPPLER